MCQLRKKLVKLLLALIQFTTASIVDTEEGHNAVDNKKTVFVANKEFGDLIQKLHLMFRIDSAGISNVILR